MAKVIELFPCLNFMDTVRPRLAHTYHQSRFPQREIPRGEKQSIIIEDGHCVRCGKKPPEVELDVGHIIPISHGGNDCDYNLVAQCSKCNRAIMRDRLPYAGEIMLWLARSRWPKRLFWAYNYDFCDLMRRCFIDYWGGLLDKIAKRQGHWNGLVAYEELKDIKEPLELILVLGYKSEFNCWDESSVRETVCEILSRSGGK